MFKKQLTLFLLFLGTLRATILDPGVEAATEGDPSNTLCNSVSILTGDFVAFSQDLVIDGAHPLRIQRQYVSGNGKGEHGGWEFFPHLELRTVSYKNKKKKSKNFRRAIVREPNGTYLVFKKQEKHSLKKGHIKYTVDFEKNGKGITNTARGVISGRTNLKNYALYQVTESKILLRCADETERLYLFSHYDSTEQKMPVFLLYSETSPTGQQTFYKYDAFHRILSITKTSKNTDKVYAWCQFHYQDNPSKSHDFEIETSDGKRLAYTFICKGKSSKNPRFFLKTVDGPDLPPEHIEYNKRHDTTDHLVKARCLPNKRSIEAEYSLPENRVTALYQSLGAGGERIATHRFTYHIERGKPGSTDIFDAYENKTTVHYSSRFLPQEVLYYDKDQLHHSMQSIWDEHGQLLEQIIAEADGAPKLIKKYKYDHRGNVLQEKIKGNLTSLYSHDTYTIEQDYNEQNLITEKREPSGLITKISYKKQTPLIEEKSLSDGNAICIKETYKYNQNNLLTEKITDDGVRQKIQKIHHRKEAPALDLPEIIEEKAKDPLTGEECLVSKIHLHYNEQAKLVQKDVYGSDHANYYSIQFHYDDRGRLIKEEKPLDFCTYFDYDTNDNPIWEKDPSEKQTLRKYDNANRLIEDQEVMPEGETRTTYHQYDYKNNKTASIDPFGNETTYAYDAFGHMTHTTHPDGAEETFAYDIFGNPISYTDPLHHTLHKTYNALGRPLTIHHPNGSQETFTYTLDGNLESHRQQDGLTIHYQYDALGRKTALTYLDLNGKKLGEETFQYEGLLLISHTDKEGITTSYEYDFAGRKIAMQREKLRIEYAYDALGRIEKEKQINAENTLITAYAYNLIDQITRETQEDLEGNILHETRYIYDKRGNCTATLKENFEEHWTYDTFNRLICHENGEGHRTLIAYDEEHLNEQGQKVLRKITTDPAGYRTIEIYDIFMRLACKKIQNPWGPTLFCEEYFHDQNGNCTTQKSHIFEETDYLRTLVISREYDEMNRVISLQEGAHTSEEKTTFFTYTPGGKLAQMQKPDQTLLTYRYDPFGNLIELRSSDGTVHYTYAYNRNSQLLSAHDHIQHTTTTREVDADGNVLLETLANNLTVQNTFDALGRRTTLHLPTDQSIAYTYNPLHLQQVTALGHTTTYTYDQSDNLLARGDTTYGYDQMGRPIELHHPHFEQTLTYDTRGNIIEMEKESFPLTYTYDGLNQLIKENAHTYSYDSAYNRRAKDGKPYQTNTIHSLTAAGENTYTYDPNGNPTAKITPSKTFCYKYDALDRLMAVETENEKTTFTYDHFHRRMTKTHFIKKDDTWKKHSHQKFLYDGQREIGACKENNTFTELRILGLHERDALLVQLHNKTYLPVQDLQGNTVRLIALDQSQIHAYQYNAFGEESPDFNPNPWRYASKRYDPDIGLIYFGQRYYDSETGRWLTPDPSTFTDSFNLYAYTFNNPFLYIDAYGLFSEPTHGRPNFKYSAPPPESQDMKFLAFENSVEDIYYFRRTSEYGPFYKPPFPYKEKSSIFDLNKPEIPNRRIMFVNGILNEYKDAYASAEYISKFAGGANVHGVHSATYGLEMDLQHTNYLLKYTITESVKLLHQAWDDYFQNAGPDATILIFSHSRGAAVMRNALMTYSEERRKRIFSIAIAPAAYTNPDHCAAVKHYRSPRDPVPKVDKYGAKKYASTIYTLNPHPESKYPDHEFQSPTYKKPIIDVIKLYLETGEIE